MEDNYYYYFSLNAFLSRADRHYVEARFLWMSCLAVDGSCNLFWLGIEQIIKLNIIQQRLENKLLEDVIIKENGNRKLYSYDPQETDIRKIYKILDRTYRKIDSKHRLDRLLQVLLEETEINLYKFEDTLKKVKEFYERRYYIDEGTSINGNIINDIDEIYFYLRGYLNESIPRSLIDEIALYNKFSVDQTMPHHFYACKDNKYFKSRKHPVVNTILPDGRIIINDGDKDKLFRAKQ